MCGRGVRRDAGRPGETCGRRQGRQTRPTVAAKAAETKPEPAAKPAPAEQALPVNIKIEVVITDQTGTNPGAKKVVSMIVGDRQSTNIRSSASRASKAVRGPPGPVSFNYRNVTINVDARPAIVLKDPTKILVSFGLEYSPKGASSQERWSREWPLSTSAWA